MKYTAIILAAGQGKRMQSETAKQFLKLSGKPVLYYSLKAFEDSEIDQIILVTGAGEEEKVRLNLVERYGFHKVTKIIPGGAERYDSVYCGLEAAQETDYVLIHDAARPLVTKALIREMLKTVQKSRACVCGVPSKDTMKEVSSDGTVQKTLERSTLWNIQTPQAFEYSLIIAAYKKLFELTDIGITDDASVVEQMTKVPVRIVPGSYDNIKITTPEDLAIAKVLLDRQQQKENTTM